MIGDALSADRCRSAANRYRPYLRYTAPQMIRAALRLTGAALQLVGTYHPYLRYTTPQMIGVLLCYQVPAEADTCRPPPKLIGATLQLTVAAPYLRYTVPQLISASFQLEGVALR